MKDFDRFLDTVWWVICPTCERKKYREAILNWANFREFKQVIIVECTKCKQS